MTPTYKSGATGQDSRHNTSPSLRQRDAAGPRAQTPRIAGESNGIPWGVPEGEVERYDPQSKLSVDKSRSRQVYDDQNILVLSGGVMLGRNGQPYDRSYSPARSGRHPVPVPPLSIDPSSMMPSAGAPSLGSSASSSFSGDYLLTPGEWSPAYKPSWADDDPMHPMVVPPPQGSMASWASYSFPPQTTTVTTTAPYPPPSANPGRGHHHPRVERVRFDDMTPTGIPLPISPEVHDDFTSAFSSLQVTSIAELGSEAGDYDNDEEERDVFERRGSLPPSRHRERSPSPSAAPFRRSSLGAVVELSGRNPTGSSVSKAILRDREAHATHRRARPSM